MGTVFMPEYLERQSIEAILEETYQMPLQVVVAPMGYGKTTLVQHFLDKYPHRQVIWLSLGQNEVDDEWVWSRLLDKLSSYSNFVTQRINGIRLPQNAPEIQHLMQILKSSITSPITIVVDDFHECESKNLNRLFEMLGYEKIENLHIIILSRTYPDFPCQEMWMKGCCALIDQDTFIMSRQEISDFYRLNGITLPEEVAEKIYQVTDGWMAAVYLSLVNYHKKGYFESAGSIMQLLKTSIFDKSEKKTELMKLSFLDHFTKEQAIYILGYNDAPDDQKSTGQDGFIKYDFRNETYQIHSLLRSVAENELNRSEIDKNELLLRCARWYEKEGDYINALIFYRKLHDHDGIYHILDNQEVIPLYEKAPVIFAELEKAIGIEEKMCHVKPYIQYIYFLLMSSGFRAGRKNYEEALVYCGKLSEEGDRILGELYILGAIINFNDLENMIACLDKAKELLKGGTSRVFDKNYILTMGAQKILMMYYRRPGELKRTVDLEKMYIDKFMSITNGIEGEWDQLLDSEFLLTTGNLAEAEKGALIACEKAKIQNRKCIVISTYFTIMLCDICLGRRIKFNEHMKELTECMKEGVSGLQSIQYELVMGFLYALTGQTDNIALWLQDFDLCKCNEIIRSLRSGCMVYGIILGNQGKWEKLEALSLEMQKPYGNTCHVFVKIIAILFRAVASLHLYGTEEALKHMRQAILLAEPDHVVLVFAMSYRHIMPVMPILAKESDYIRDMLPLCRSFEKGAAVFQAGKENYSLTKREEEILALLGEGCKNTEISERLHIALVTVEKILKNVYIKLGVTNRTGAILKMYELKEREH